MIRKVALILAVVLFLGGLAWSISVFPVELSSLRPLPALAVVFIGVPVTVLLNAWEFLLSVHYTQKKATLRSAVEVTVVATAANMLPLPGGTIARVSALSSLGVGLRTGIAVNLLIALLWLGLALVYSGVWIRANDTGYIANLFMATGAIVSIAAFYFLGRNSGSWLLAGKLSGMKTALLVVDSARLLLCFWALGVPADFAQSSALALSSVLGSAVSVVPAGLGVREAAAGALSTIVGLALAAGFLATALNRILGLAAILPLAAVISRGKLKSGKQAVE